MSLHPLDSLLFLLLTALCFGLLVKLTHFDVHPAPLKMAHRHAPRPLRPHTPDNCQHCRDATSASRAVVVQSVVPYAQRKSPWGRKKRIDTCGQACPNPKCDYHEVTDPAVHALVGYGHHGGPAPIQDFYCQACHRKFSARRYTPLYRLKAPATRVAQVLHAVAEGLSAQAAARVFQMSETTIRSWITRAGQHSHGLHHQWMRALQLTHVQLDELRLKLHGATDAAWLWFACDARTKIIPAFALGPRTQALADQLVHELAQRLAPGCLPIFSSDGLALYFYALTAAFGQWVPTVGERRRVWTVAAQLLYAQVTPHLRWGQVSNNTVVAASPKSDTRFVLVRQMHIGSPFAL